ncbi:MAG: hypothetical protein WBG48_13160 [Pricia sp.]
MAFVVLLTTSSFTIDMHYCGDTLVDFSFVQKVEACAMEKVQSPQPCESSMSEKSCCSDEQFAVDGQDEVKISFDQLSFEQQTFIASLFYTYINPFIELDESIVPFKAYSPPFLIRDVQTLHETYLI